MATNSDRLVQAAAEGNEGAVRGLVAAGANVNFGNALGETALMAAARGGYAGIVRYLVDECRADMNIRFPNRGDGWTALMYSGYYGRVSILRFLIEAGADFSLKSSDGLTVLEQAPCCGASLVEVQDAVALSLQTRAETLKAEPFTVAYGNVNMRALTAASSVAPDSAGGGYSSAPATAAGSGRFDVSSAGFSSGGPSSAGAKSDAAAGGAAKLDLTALGKWSGAGSAPLEASDITVARPRMVDVYQTICGDFGLRPSQQVIEAILNASHDLVDAGLGAIALGGYYSGGAKLGDAGAVPLLEMLSHAFPNAPLHSIDLSYNGLTNISAAALASFVSRSRCLVSLNLEGNDITGEGGVAIARALAQSQVLQSLNISRNALGDAAVCELVQSLGGSDALASLDLSATDMELPALIQVAQLLQRKRGQLERVTLDSPLVRSEGEDGVIHLARALPQASLSSLSLAHHRITDHGAMWLADCLRRSQTLTDLNLQGNQITPTGVAHLARALRRRRVPCFVNLDGNPLTDQLLDEVDEALVDPPGEPDPEVAAAEAAAGVGADGLDAAGAKFVVEFETGQPIDQELVDRFAHNRHYLMARLVQPDASQR